MSTSNPSLGQLDRLSAELRNRIYELAADSSCEEVNLSKPCHAHGALALVSKQVSRESIPIITRLDKKKCQHHRFVFKVPANFGWMSKLTAHLANGSAHDISSDPVTYRLLTAHLREDAPSAIMIVIVRQTGLVKFHGANAEWNHEAREFTKDLNGLLSRSKAATGHIDTGGLSMFIGRMKDHLRFPPGALREAGKPPTAEELRAICARMR